MGKIKIKVVLFLLLILVTFGLTSCSSLMGYGTTEAKVVYDEYSDISYINKSIALPIQMSGWWKLSLHSYDDETVYFGLSFTNPDWYFIDRLDLIIDDSRYHFYDGNPSQNVLSNGNISEYASFDIPIKVFEKMEDCDNGKMRFSGSKGSKEFKITDEMQEEFDDYLDFVEENGKILYFNNI